MRCSQALLAILVLAAAPAARGVELRDRRDERKAIMDEARTAAEPGTPRKGKRSWWRFWESDAADASE